MKILATQLYLLPIENRVPLKFGTETVTRVTCGRVRMEAQDASGRRAVGWGETPLAVQWVWPSAVPYAERHECIVDFTGRLGQKLIDSGLEGHPIEIGRDFQEHVLPGLLRDFNAERPGSEPMPWLAALLCSSIYDVAAHDAYGFLVNRPCFETYGPEFLSRDLAELMEDHPGFRGKYPADFLVKPRRERLPAWHLVGGLDPLEPADITSPAPNDGYPVLLRDWIHQDGLTCLKIKLRGNDSAWDYQRLVAIGQIAQETGVKWLTADFNCTVREPAYVNEILDRVLADHPEIHRMIVYVEQPFPYELEVDRIDVRSLAARKPLFLDESAHDWRHVKLGRELGWTGVALKTCKTLTGALLSASWAQVHGMSLMVQDLSNPMMAQISHVQLAANVPTIMGVETNGMQFYPEASKPEAAVHPGLFRR
ncbi:MAG TPA: enolase C-terminal domain-like protein, partial [Tepidisphaeraceae bacterium]|nr:enolase C-terminal domain-like protein [Tepidisphaeraceae bacterium]